jgi:tRNA(Ile)-lysidine synthase
VHELAERLLEHIRRQELLHAGDRVGVAVSSGIDSVALLRLLLELKRELGVVLSIIHFNHKLRGAESDGDQEFVAKLACQHGLEFLNDGEDVAQRASDEHVSVEAAARELRYGFFRQLLGSGEGGAETSSTSGAEAQDLESPDRSAESAAPPKSDPQGLKPQSFHGPIGTAEAVPFPESPPLAPPPAILLTKIATGHTLDDQAETVLMRLVRGTGLRGLGGIHPRLVVEDDAGDTLGEMIRPLLEIRRRELEQYLKSLGQPWREDSTNTDVKFTRNRMRQLVLPLLERDFNPSVAENLAELAEIARGEEDFWENEVSGWLGTTVQWSEPEWAQQAQSLVLISPAQAGLPPRMAEPGPPVMNASVSRAWLLTEPLAVQRRLVKAVGEYAGIPLEFKHIEEVLRFAAEEHGAGKKLSLPLGWKMVREPASLVFLAPNPRNQERAQEYEYELPIPGRAMVSETGTVIEALRIQGGSQATAYNSQHLLDPDLLPGPLKVRNWRPGDRFWPAHTKSLKKIKELLAERGVAQAERRLWPVVVSGNEIVWVRGFSVPATLRAKSEREAILIRETALSEDPK